MGLHQTACHAWHAAHNGRLVDFAGWEMPVQYASITDEHNAVRNAAGLFDIAHMGRVRFDGADAAKFLNHLVTIDVAKLGKGRIRYSLVTNEQGGILDDVLVYRLADHYMLVVNASNREKILSWIEQHRQSFDVTVTDETFDRFMLAIQGPRAEAILDPLVPVELGKLRYYRALSTTVNDVPALISRTGYTGEDGFEVIVAADAGRALWELLIERGGEAGLLPAGLGCRDTLRLEAAMPLYGHELSEEIDPITAGLDFAVALDKTDFLGKQALATAAGGEREQTRVGFELDGRRIAREHTLLFQGEERIGEVTSGTFSPTFEKPIGMAYVRSSSAEVGTAIEAEIRGKRVPGRIVKLPFYARP